jgi:hypothetical protein
VTRELSIRTQHGALATIREERAVARRIRALEGQAIERRAEDALRRELASGRMKDIKSLTKDALEAGGEIADVLADEVQARPFFARELADIASTGARGLKAGLRGYVEEGH